MSGSSHPLRHLTERNPGVGRKKTVATITEKLERYELKRTLTVKALSKVAVFAALYTVLVWLFQPFGFAALQFRVAEGLKPSIAKVRTLAVAFAIGNFLGNLVSPFAGIYELAFMPTMNIVGGLLAYYAAKIFKGNYFVAALVYGTTIGLSVSWMLHALFNIPLLDLIPFLLASELIAMILGAVAFLFLEKRWKWYQ
ncbi:QueT transporter family protein [Candidatus Bathyarchaeota archaeon]|nr:MAG: QueT transporter family protein [Candidatus Bathyarchaeota archaeon]